MRKQAMDLQSVTSVLRGRWRLVAGVSVAGLLLGAGYAVLQPPRLGSTTLVLLPTPTVTQDTTSEVATQVRIVLSTTVLAQAGRAVTPKLSAAAVERTIEVSAPTTQIIEIQAFAGRAAEAQALSQGVADAYIASVRDTARTITAATLTDLRTRETALEGQVKALQTELDTTSARQHTEDPVSSAGVRDAQLLAQLRVQQADVSLQLDRVKDDIATSASLGSASGAGTAVVQPASPATGSPLPRRLLTWVPIGWLLGALAATAALLARARQDPRLRLRDEIADAVGAQVLAAVRSRPQRSVAAWSALLETSEPGPVEAWAFRQVLRALAPVAPRPAGRADQPSSVTVVSLAGDARGLAVGPQLAAFAVSHGIVTRVVTSVGHDSAAPLWAACAGDRPTAPRPGLLIGDGSDGERDQEVAADGEGADRDAPVGLTIVLAVADRGAPNFAASPRTATTLLAVASGTASQAELARLAVALDDADRRVDGIVVADPDPADRTTGRRTLDERVRQVALPVRLTGIGPVAVRSGGNGTGR